MTHRELACDQAAPRAKSGMPFAGGGMFSPSPAYSLSLLRSVRIEMPRIFAAWVRLPRQCFKVSRMSSHSTSASVRPTRIEYSASS